MTVEVSLEERDVIPEVYPRESHCISRNDIDIDAVKIMYRLVRNGFKAYLVGGGVRDLLLKKQPKDFDIATDATPREVKSLFRNCRIIGRRFKLAHIFFNNQKIIEVSTFRDASPEIDADEPDHEDESPKAVSQGDNRFGTEATDAFRRDITVNALFYDASSFSIIDYVGGMKDLKEGIIRVIGDPDVRFAEDPVRLMRVVRHAARNGFEIEKRCLQSLKTNRDLLNQSAPVRVYEEFKKDLCSGRILPILRLLAHTTLLDLLIPQLALQDGALLEEGAHLPIVLERLDEIASKVPVHVAFALLALHIPFSGEPLYVDVYNRFPDGEGIREHLQHAFSVLMMARKEKERVEQLLRDWVILCELHEKGFSEISGYFVKEQLEDLVLFYYLISGEEPSDDLIAHLEERLRRRGRESGRGPRRRGRRR